MISYEPLKETLAIRDMNISELRQHGIHPTTIAKINRNEPISLTQIERICKALNCAVEDVLVII